MLWVTVAALAAAGVAGYAYLVREKLGPPGLGLAALRATAFIALVMLFFNPARTRRVSGGPPTVLLDASISMNTAGGHWRQALDSAQAIAPSSSAIIRFGTKVRGFDTLPPSDGTTRLADALRLAASRGGPVVVVTDGELDDAGAISPSLLRGVRFVVVPRDTVPNAALVDVAMESRVQRNDSVTITVQVVTQGHLAATRGTLEISDGGRRLLSTDLQLAQGPANLRRTVKLHARALDPGVHVLAFRLTVPGDSVTGDDVRMRVFTITEQPSIVVVLDPPDWEGRFLSNTLGQIAHAPIRSFARVAPGRWADTRTQSGASETEVRGAIRGAALVVLRGRNLPEQAAGRRPFWHWPEGVDPSGASLSGDWYVGGDLPASPIAARLGSIAWDSVPPLDGMLPSTVSASEWVGMNARLGRRGAERPVVIGRDSAGVRTLSTAGGGLWRWAFRGGESREAYRGLIAGGVDWLLGAAAIRRTEPLTAAEVGDPGLPPAFRWAGDPTPDSIDVRIAGKDSTVTRTLRFDSEGIAAVDLPPGIYRWTAPAFPRADGVIAVEDYSDEYHLRPVNLPSVTQGASFASLEVRPRDRWFWFMLAVAAFVGEWAWRLRRGLP